MMRKLLFLIWMLFMLPLTSSAQVYACRGFIEDNYNFLLYLPDSYAGAA